MRHGLLDYSLLGLQSNSRLHNLFLSFRSNMSTRPECPQFTEGIISFFHSVETFHTYYKVFGKLEGRVRDPLVVLHGGPGLVHDYLFPFIDLADEYEIPVILYDQLGNGISKGKNPHFGLSTCSLTSSSIFFPAFPSKTVSISWAIPGVESSLQNLQSGDSQQVFTTWLYRIQSLHPVCENNPTCNCWRPFRKK